MAIGSVKYGTKSYLHPTTHSPSIIEQDSSNRFVTDVERTKLNGIATGANNYTHPATHSPSIIAQDANNRFVTDVEKSLWNSNLVGDQMQDLKNTINAIQADNKTVYVLSNNIRHTFTYELYSGDKNGTLKLMEFRPKRDGVIKIEFIPNTTITLVGNGIGDSVPLYTFRNISSTESGIRYSSAIASIPRAVNDDKTSYYSTYLDSFINIPQGTIISGTPNDGSNSPRLEVLMASVFTTLGRAEARNRSSSSTIYTDRKTVTSIYVNAGEQYDFYSLKRPKIDGQVVLTLNICYDEVML